MRLNLGCGGQVAEGWVNIDRAGDPPIVIHDLRDPLPYADRTATGAVAHHVLDLLAADDLRALLAEVYRVLEHGAVLRVSLADITNATIMATAGNQAWFPEQRATLDETFSWFVLQGGARRTPMTRSSLCSRLSDAGFLVFAVAFNETTGKPWLCDLDTREHESIWVEAEKP